MAVEALTLFRGVVVYVRLADVDDASARRRAATRSWAAAAWVNMLAVCGLSVSVMMG